ncbi:MAG TPA: YceI family protein [Burkholderiales bacterium]|nr:YceI family protein [Burkholderiales bacterium]
MRSLLTVSPLPSIVCFIASVASPALTLAAEQYKIDPNHTFVHFAVVHTGVSSVRGRFNVAKGNASLDAAKQEATVTVEIDTRSLDTGVKQLDGILVGETFFDVAKFRTATFSGRAVQFTDGVPTAFEGELTVKGVTHPVRLAAERFVCQEVTVLVIKHFVCGGDLTGTLKRSDFGMSKYLSMVSDEVRLTISVEGIREGK